MCSAPKVIRGNKKVNIVAFGDSIQSIINWVETEGRIVIGQGRFMEQVHEIRLNLDIQGEGCEGQRNSVFDQFHFLILTISHLMT